MGEGSPVKTKVPTNGDSHITTYPAWCKKCGICIAFCPKGVLEPAADGSPIVAHPEKCIRCRLCELRCPDFAISVADDENGEAK